LISVCPGGLRYVSRQLSRKKNKMDDYTWTTDYLHVDNTQTMNEYLEKINMLDIIEVNGSYAEGINSKGEVYAIHASGNGDSFNHRIRFELIES
jgi:hypothetical protein